MSQKLTGVVDYTGANADNAVAGVIEMHDGGTNRFFRGLYRGVGKDIFSIR